MYISVNEVLFFPAKEQEKIKYIWLNCHGKPVYYFRDTVITPNLVWSKQEKYTSIMDAQNL